MITKTPPYLTDWQRVKQVNWQTSKLIVRENSGKRVKENYQMYNKLPEYIKFEVSELQPSFSTKNFFVENMVRASSVSRDKSDYNNWLFACEAVYLSETTASITFRET